MKQVIVGEDQLFGPWLAEKTNGAYSPHRGPTIGLLNLSNGTIAGAAQFTDCNGASVVLHCAGEGKNWLNREFLWFCFYYPFEQLKVRKIISPVESWNTDCIRFIENLGFVPEATLKDASPKGDLILYTLSRENSIWHLKRKSSSEQAESPSGS